MDQLSRLTAREKANGRPVTWRKLTKRATCDECLAVTHENYAQALIDGDTKIGYGRIIRTVDGADLYLCWRHADAWKARDRDE